MVKREHIPNIVEAKSAKPEKAAAKAKKPSRLPPKAETFPLVASQVIKEKKRAIITQKTEQLKEKKITKKKATEQLFEEPTIEPILTQKGEEGGPEASIYGKTEKLFPNAPDMNREDFLTRNGRYVDYTAAETLPQLVNLLREVGEVTNNNDQTIEADTIINLIYEYIYQPKPDWTKITLRHRLRETVYALIEKYKKTPEYLNNLSQVGLFNINNLQDLKAEIIKKSFWTLPNGLTVGNQTIISLIDNGLINDLPGPIREKVISLNKVSASSAQPPKKEGWGARIKSWFSKK